jgi:hypothetical protein
MTGALTRHHDDDRGRVPLALRPFAVRTCDFGITLRLRLVQPHAFKGQGFIAVLLAFDLSLQPFIDSLGFLSGLFAAFLCDFRVFCGDCPTSLSHATGVGGSIGEQNAAVFLALLVNFS